MHKIAHKISEQYFQSFDILKVILSFFVVGWHLKIFGINLQIFSQNTLTLSKLNFFDYLYVDVFLLAVPLYYLMSLYVYLHKRQTDAAYFRRRIASLLKIFGFWYLFNVIVIGRQLNIKEIFSITTIISGWNSHIYYLFSLILLLSATELTMFVKTKILRKNHTVYLMCLLCVSIIFVLMGVVVGIHGLKGADRYLTSYYSPFNFLPYTFIGALLFRYRSYLKRIKSKYITLLIIFGLVVSVLEIVFINNISFFSINGMRIPQYGRLSILILSTSIFIYSIQKKLYLKEDVIEKIKSFSTYTFGIYIVHYYLILFFNKILFPQTSYLMDNRLVYFLFIYIASFIAVFFFKKSILIFKYLRPSYPFKRAK